MTPYVEIAVNVPHVKGVFHYSVPDSLQETIQTGHLVTVPFGRQTVQGIVMRSIAHPEVPETKDVIQILDPLPAVTTPQIQLAEHMAQATLSSVGICIHTMLPSGLSVKPDVLVSFSKRSQERLEAGKPVYENLTTAQERLIKLLQDRGPLRGRQIDHALPQKRWRATVRALQRRGVLKSEPVLQEPSVQPKRVNTVELAVEPAELEVAREDLAQSGYPEAQARRKAILDLLLAADEPLPVGKVYEEAGGNLADLRRLDALGYLHLYEASVLRDPLDDLTTLPPQSFTLTTDQEAVWAEIHRALTGEIAQPKPFLLYGVTGSGKTEIYLRAVQETLAQGRQALILVPEIALTPQTVRRFLRRFPDQVGVLHSELSSGERYDTWRMARAGELSIVVGPRSALFTPFPEIGLIVVDECHDDSYYQAEMPPHYHARREAVAYAEICGAACLMGSATPNVTSTYRAARGEWQALSLPERILAHKETVQDQMAQAGKQTPSARFTPLENEVEMAELPPVKVVDMRGELKAGNRSIFSRTLQERLAAVLDQGQQAILFLNRRGAATYVFCRDCGYALKCPRCDTSLTYHLREDRLRCHRCGYQRRMPAQCPECGSGHIKHYGTGTEEVERALSARFPEVRPLRWDRDTTRQKGAHDKIMAAFKNHEADVLIGTQMLAKGLDLPLVTLVGIVLADMGLNFPDYRTNERTFQLLTQVSGRAGRSPLGGQVILQTFEPDHFVIQTASEHDYRAFYRQEIADRRALGYPPYSHLVRLETRDTDQKKARERAGTLAKSLRTWMKEENYRGTQMIGPVPCFFARVRGEYRWQIVLRGPDPAGMLADRTPGPDWKVEVDPPSLL